MKRISFGSIVRGFVFCLALAVFAGVVLPPSAVKGSGFGACALALHDAVLSLLTSADGDPERTRVSKYGALWTKDSDLADTIDALGWNITTEQAQVFPVGTRTITLGLFPTGIANGPASATDFISIGGASGALHYKLHPGNEPLVLDNLDAPITGTTLYFQTGGGQLTIRAIWTVSQNPD